MSTIKINKHITDTINFNLDSLQKLCPKLSDNWANFVAEASAFCLEYNDHSSGTFLKLRGDVNADIILTWDNLQQSVAATHADIQDATEDGAVGIACGLINLITEGEFQVIEKSFKGTGFDYWVGEANSNNMFQNKSKLEISGLINGTSKEVEYRTNQKIRQVQRSHTSLISLVIVVEFSKPLSEVTKNG